MRGASQKIRVGATNSFGAPEADVPGADRAGAVRDPAWGDARGKGSMYRHPALEATEGAAGPVRPEGPPARADRPRRGAPVRDRGREALSLRVSLLPDHRLPPRGRSRRWCSTGRTSGNDLRLFIEDLSATVGQKLEQAAEPVLTVDAVSRRYNVSTRTVNRWRSQGSGRPPIRHRRGGPRSGSSNRASSGSSTLTTSRSSGAPGSDNSPTRSGRRSSDAPAGWPRSAATTA